MPQDSVSGAAARAYGHKTATAIGRKLGAVKTSQSSNEFDYQGRKTTIRTARKKTNSVGVTEGMLGRVGLVIAAFQTRDSDGTYNLYSLPTEIYKNHCTVSKSADHVRLVRKSVFVEKGTFVAAVVLN